MNRVINQLERKYTSRSLSRLIFLLAIKARLLLGIQILLSIYIVYIAYIVSDFMVMMPMLFLHRMKPSISRRFSLRTKKVDENIHMRANRMNLLFCGWESRTLVAKTNRDELRCYSILWGQRKNSRPLQMNSFCCKVEKETVFKNNSCRIGIKLNLLRYFRGTINYKVCSN